MTAYYGIRARFNLRLEIRGRNPEDAWRRAHTCARLISENANRVEVYGLEHRGNHLTKEQRAAMTEARKAIAATMDFDERADYWRLHRAMGILTHRLHHLEAKHDQVGDELPEPTREREERESWALGLALHVLDGALRAHEPLQVAEGPLDVTGGSCLSNPAHAIPRASPGATGVNADE